MIHIGIDPGNTHSAAVAIKEGSVISKVYLPNDEFIYVMISLKHHVSTARFVCEMIASYGMPVGREVFETCVFIGRLKERLTLMDRITRISVKNSICHSSKAKDANVRQALIDIYGPPGTKKNPGGTYGIKGDMWAALAVATAAQKGAQLY